VTPSTPATDLRARKRNATHDALAATAFNLARAHGLDGFTIDDVARAADVSRRTFFNHFGSKEEAVTEIVRVRVENLLDEVDERLAAGPPVRVDDADGGILGLVVRSLLAPESIATFRPLITLTEASPELLPHLARIQNDGTQRIARLMHDRAAIAHGRALPPVYAYAIPGALMATVSAVYTGHIHVHEIDGEAPDAIGIDDVVSQLRGFVPRKRSRSTPHISA
jgi:AcrR family transcriptional regulator